MNVGFIGVGVMGAPMARSLARGRHDVAVYDASPRALDPFRDGKVVEMGDQFGLGRAHLKASVR